MVVIFIIICVCMVISLFRLMLNSIKWKSFDYLIETSTATTKPSRPQITSTDNFHVYDGDDLHLMCSVDIEKGTKASLLWGLPSNDRAIKVNRYFQFAEESYN